MKAIVDMSNCDLHGLVETEEGFGQLPLMLSILLLLAVTAFSRRVFGTLDTGAVSTDLNSKFEDQFREQIQSQGTVGTGTIARAASATWDGTCSSSAEKWSSTSPR